MMRVLMVSRAPWGTLTDAYKLATLAAKRFSVSYLGLQPGGGRVFDVDGVEVEGLSATGPKILRLVRLLWRAIMAAYGGADIVYVYYFPGCSLLRMAVWRRPVVLDVRTCCVSERRLKRLLSDWLLRLEARCFRRITVVSAGLARRLCFPERKVTVIPLGADPIPAAPKEFEKWDLLYVGCFDDRRLEIFLEGFARFCRDARHSVRLTIVGGGFNGERVALESRTRELGLSDVVRFAGYIPHAELGDVFRNANAGISFVPITPWYDVQPSTKTFEYWAAGMPVLATATKEHRAVVTNENGVLSDDTPEGVFRGLRCLVEKGDQWDSQVIRNSAVEFSWESIARRHFEPYLLSLVGGNGRAIAAHAAPRPEEVSA